MVLLSELVEKLGYQPLINRRGTTWRKLATDQQNAVVDAESACQLMCRYPTLIKRPLLRAPGGELLLGFTTTQYQHFIYGKD